MNSKKCVICSEGAQLLMNDVILNKYNIDYYLCNICNCIFTENPYWLTEAYGDSISLSDTGILKRNTSICDELMIVFNTYFDPKVKVVDFGGGYGILTRMLRDKGVNAFWHDKYSDNLLSKGFEYDGNEKVDVMLAFEVFEHLEDPLSVIKEIMRKTDCLIFSTQMLNSLDYKTNKEWWYFTPETGQHIFFPSKITINKIVQLIGCKYQFINGFHILHNIDRFNKVGLVLFMKRLLLKGLSIIMRFITQGFFFKSKTWEDHIYMKGMINNQSELIRFKSSSDC